MDRVRSEGLLDDLILLAGTEQHADGGLFVRLPHIAVERFQIEGELLLEVLGLEAADFQFKGDEAVEAAVEKEQVEREVAAADLHGILRADEAEVVTEFDEEILEFEEQTVMEIGLGVAGGKAEELQHVGVFEDAYGFWG